MYETRPRKEHPQGAITVLYAAIPAGAEGQGPDGAHGGPADHKGLETLSRIAAEKGGTIVRKGDYTLLACFTDPVGAVRAAILMQGGPPVEGGGECSSEVRIVLHHGSGSFSDGAIHGDIAVFAAEAGRIAKAGRIYVSSAVSVAVRDVKAVELKPVDVTQRLLSGHRAFYDLVWRGDADAAGAGQDGPVFFAHSRALLEGDYRPCFYCGARRHPASDCPSKHLLYRTRGLAGLGRLSIGEINERFAQYLDSAEGERLSVPADADIDMVDPVYLVPLAFYELRKAFQIRFMNVIWSASPRDEWYKVREVGRETSAKGGVLWIARDCIRVSDLNEAEKLLMRYGRQNRDDYRAACGLAFIKMEREEYRDACDLFHEALEQAVSPAQKTYLHLLMSRIWELLEKRDKSLEALKEAIRIEPYCLEAKFEDAARHFQLGRQTDGLNRLIKLLKLSHEFYLPALISPELAEFRPAIASELDKLRVEVLIGAREAAREADAAVAGLTRFLGTGDEGAAEVLSIQEHLHGLLAKPEAFLLCREAMYTAQRIVGDCRAIEMERAGDVRKVVKELSERAGAMVRGVSAAARMGLQVRPIQERLKGVEGDLSRREPFARCLEQCVQLSRELDGAEEVARRWKERVELLRACGTFLTDLCFVLFVTVITGLVLFPGVLHCLDALNSGWGLSSVELWPVQKSVLIIGAVLAVGLAIGHAFMGRLRA